MTVIHEFLSPDENHRILADKLFSSMYQHNQLMSHDDNINISLLTNQLDKISEVEQFVHGVLHYLQQKVLQQSILGVNQQSNYDQYPILVTAQYPNTSLSGMVGWIKIIASHFPSTIPLLTEYMQSDSRDFFIEIIQQIRKNNKNDDLFIPMIKDAFVDLLKTPLLFAHIIDNSEKLQLLAWQKIQNYPDCYNYYITPFLHLKSPSTRFIDSFYTFLVEKEAEFPEPLFAHYLADLAYLTRTANYNTDYIRALLLPTLQENKIIDIPLIHSLKYIIEWPKDRLLVNEWITDKDPWKRLAAYGCYISITDPPVELVNTALEDIGRYNLGNDQPHSVACQALSYWHQQGIDIPLEPIIKWLENILNSDNISDQDYEFISSFQALSKIFLPLLLEKQDSLVGVKNSQQPVSSHYSPLAKNHRYTVNQLSDREVNDALLNLEEIKHLLIIQRKSTKLASLALESKTEELLTLIKSMEEKLFNFQINASEQRQYLILIDEKIDYIQSRLDSYIDQELSEFAQNLDKDSSKKTSYSQQDYKKFMQALNIKERMNPYPSNQEANNFLKLINSFQSSQ